MAAIAAVARRLSHLTQAHCIASAGPNFVMLPSLLTVRNWLHHPCLCSVTSLYFPFPPLLQLSAQQLPVSSQVEAVLWGPAVQTYRSLAYDLPCSAEDFVEDLENVLDEIWPSFMENSSNENFWCGSLSVLASAATASSWIGL